MLRKNVIPAGYPAHVIRKNRQHHFGGNEDFAAEAHRLAQSAK